MGFSRRRMAIRESRVNPTAHAAGVGEPARSCTFDTDIYETKRTRRGTLTGFGVGRLKRTSVFKNGRSGKRSGHCRWCYVRTLRLTCTGRATWTTATTTATGTWKLFELIPEFISDRFRELGHSADVELVDVS
jgi:hypothetical protein